MTYDIIHNALYCYTVCITVSTLSSVIYCVYFLWCQSLVSEEDDDEDEEEGKTAVQADEKNKNNKPGLHGRILFSSDLKYTCFIIVRFQQTGKHMFFLTDVMVSRRTDRERIPVRYCTLGTRDATRYRLLFRHINDVFFLKCELECDRH